MRRLMMCLFLVLALQVSGCGQENMPSWLKFGQPKKIEQKPQPKLEEVKGTVLASANGRIITLEDFNNRIQAYNQEIQASKDIPETVKPNYLIKTAEDKKRLLEGMVERELIVAEAIARGLDKDEELLQAVKALKEQLLFAKVIELEKDKVTVTTKEIENYYNLYKDAFAIPEERKVSMIVAPTEDKGKEILIALLQGADFATLARANSTDESAAQGGDIGFIVRKSPFPQEDKKTMFEKFEEIAFSLELNEPSTLFKGDAGFYIVKVTEIKKERQRLLSEVYKDLEQGLLLQKQDDSLKTLVGNLRKTANIIVHDSLIKE